MNDIAVVVIPQWIGILVAVDLTLNLYIWYLNFQIRRLQKELLGLKA